MSSHNGMHHNNKNNNVVEDHEALMYQTYPCAYYVQSPSTLSHANTDIRSNIQNEVESAFHSPIRSETHPLNPNHEEDEASRFALCRYSSSRGSSHSFLHHKKISYDGSHTTVTEKGDVNQHVVVDSGESNNDDDNIKYEEEEMFYEYYYGKKKRGWTRYFSYRNSDSSAWIWLQMIWRILLSFGIALLVFYIATKPPKPNVSFQVARFPEFKLAEGVDRTGVTTKILTCNCSLNLIIENKSRFFGLHIRPPSMVMKFSNLPFAFSNGPELYAESGLTMFALQLGVKNKAMYGAGRSMQDMLDSGRGMPLVIRVTISSSFKVVPNLINPRFHNHVECLVVLKKAYNKKHRTQAFDSTCKLK